MIANAHVLSVLAADGGPVPDRWCHDLRTGSLTYRVRDGPNTFTWPPDAVAKIAQQARAGEVSADAKRFLTRWASVERVLAADGLTPPDRIYVDQPSCAFTLVWHEHALAVVIDDDDLRSEEALNAGSSSEPSIGFEPMTSSLPWKRSTD